MIPQMQSRTGKNGRCLNACLASILEIPEAQVPDFGKDWEADVAKFLATFGLYYVQIPKDDSLLKVMFNPAHGEVWSTIEGISHRGGPHACVARNGELVWDPHPVGLDGSQPGLKSVENYGLLCSRMRGR